MLDGLTVHLSLPGHRLRAVGVRDGAGDAGRHNCRLKRRCRETIYFPKANFVSAGRVVGQSSPWSRDEHSPSVQRLRSAWPRATSSRTATSGVVSPASSWGVAWEQSGDCLLRQPAQPVRRPRDLLHENAVCREQFAIYRPTASLPQSTSAGGLVWVERSSSRVDRREPGHSFIQRRTQGAWLLVIGYWAASHLPSKKDCLPRQGSSSSW